jgi:DUF4097 and DUF4098 domain-containing protein YvlB
MTEAQHKHGRRGAHIRTLPALVALVAFFCLAHTDASAQKRVTKEYPANANVRLFINNRSGTVTVEGWDKNKVKVSASLEHSSTRMLPQVSGDEIVIDIERENREDKGDVNFTIYVPPGSSVDIQIKRGNIIVRNVRGDLVRARISTEGDIELTGIRAQTVMAENTIGNILFDAELLNRGTYALNSMRGDIQLRISAESGFSLIATSPRTRNISIGGFADIGQFRYLNDNRQVKGKVGGGGATLNTTNNDGSIVIRPRTR